MHCLELNARTTITYKYNIPTTFPELYILSFTWMAFKLLADGNVGYIERSNFLPLLWKCIYINQFGILPDFFEYCEWLRCDFVDNVRLYQYIYIYVSYRSLYFSDHVRAYLIEVNLRKLIKCGAIFDAGEWAFGFVIVIRNMSSFV